MRPNCARHIDQMLSVFRISIAKPKDSVIASEFSLFSQLRKRPPGKRVKPINANAELRDQLCQASRVARYGLVHEPTRPACGRTSNPMLLEVEGSRAEASRMFRARVIRSL